MIPVVCASNEAATATSSQHVKHKYTNATRVRTGDFAGRARAVNGNGNGNGSDFHLNFPLVDSDSGQ